MEFPISIVSTCIPQDDLVNMTDFCVYRGKKYLLCAFENTITIYNQITTVDNKKEYVVVRNRDTIEISRNMPDYLSKRYPTIKRIKRLTSKHEKTFVN